MVVNPVMFPPGRARLSTSPTATGSPRLEKQLGSSWSRSWQLGLRVEGVTRYVNLETDQLISQGGKPVELIVGVSRLESYILALDIAEFTETSPE